MPEIHDDALETPFLDLSDPAFSVRAPAVAAARAASWCARTPYGLAVLRHADVETLLRHPKMRQGSYRWPTLNGVSGVFARWWESMLLSQEGDTHARLRKMAQPAFSPRLIAGLKPRFQALANQLIDAFHAEGQCEFVSQFAEPYASGVICQLIGLKAEEAPTLSALTARMSLGLSVSYRDEVAQVDEAAARLFDYAQDLIAARRARPAEDFIGELVAANADKALLSDQELADMVVLVIFGGIDTTRAQLGLAMATFLEHPEQWALLGERPDLARPAVEEVMRVRPTITWVTREATETFVHKGVEIPAGTTLHLLSQAAGSDPEAYPDASFDIAARRLPHFGFGGGPHHCLGHAVARVDMAEALALLSRRLRAPRLAGEPRWLPDSGNTGATHLPIAFDPA